MGNPIVETESGRVSGVRREDVVSYRGIPYAAAVDGARRFHPPQPVAPWPGIRDGSARGVGALQPWQTGAPWDAYYNPPRQGPDCLTMDITAPRGAVAAPVVVWIHGGGFVTGTGSAPAHSGRTFARDGIVHVSVNYRLGIDGFTLFEDADATDNAGLRDQIAALEWVARNIAHFGGDPTRVTIMGQSAGAMSVAFLLASPAAAGLFSRAIMHSGTGEASIDISTAHERTHALAALHGTEPTRAGFARISDDRMRDAIREICTPVIADSLLRRQDRIELPFTAVHGTPSLPRPVLDALIDGASAHIPLLMSTTRDEVGGDILGLGLATQDAAPRAAELLAVHGISPEEAAAYRAARLTDEPAVVLCAALTDKYWRLPSIRMAEAHHGTTHLAEFAWQPTSVPDGLGASHASDIPFIQDDFAALAAAAPELARQLGDAPRELARELHGAVVNFIAGSRPSWDAYRPSTRTVKTFRDPRTDAE